MALHPTESNPAVAAAANMGPDVRASRPNTIDTGRHEWPGADPKPGNDPVSDALDATGVLWSFFRTHPR